MLEKKLTDQSILKAEPVSGTDGAGFAASAYIRPGVNFYTITESNLSEALQVLDTCFRLPQEQEAAREVYRNWIEGRHDFYYNFQNEQVELLGYYIFYDGDQPCGVSGIYKEPGNNDHAWVGWFGVIPEQQKSAQPEGVLPLSRQMILHLEEIAAIKGFKYLSAYTPDGTENIRAHRFYEKNGFSNSGSFKMNGETERIYRKEISPLTYQASENALVDAVRALRRGKRDIINFYDHERVSAGRSLIKSRISAGEVADLADFEYCLGLNNDLSGPYYSMAVINDPKFRHRPIAMACGSLSKNDILLISYAATASEYAGNGIGRAVVEDFIDHANKESIARDEDPVRMIALEASRLSPSFWGGKIQCRSVRIVRNDGSEADFQYLQPSMQWDRDTGLPTGEGCDSSMKIWLNGSDYEFPGVSERFMVKTAEGKTAYKDQIMDAVVDFLDSFYFIAERESFNSEQAYNTYLACRAGIIEAYNNQFSDMKEIKLV